MSIIEQPAFPPEAVSEYAGKWVALRGHEVIAAADTLEELRAMPDVQREDMVWVVPEPSSHFY
jgi:hypothetical protein